jgi:hypothetical protein
MPLGEVQGWGCSRVTGSWAERMCLLGLLSAPNHRDLMFLQKDA